jgi:hypothetical protein
MGDGDDDDLVEFSVTAEDLQHLRDDSLWHPFPGSLDTFLPTAERVRRQFKRHASELGEEAQIAEYFALRTLRDLQSSYGHLADFLTEHAGGGELQDSLNKVLVYAFVLGQKYPDMSKAERMRAGRVPWWHSDALARAAKMQDYPERPTAAAKRIHEKLKDRPDGPPSWDAVRQVLRRDLDKKKSKSEAFPWAEELDD